MALGSITGAVNTTDATPATVLTIPINTNVVLGADGYVVARRTGGSSGSTNDGAYYKISLVGANTGGTVAFIGNDAQAIGESQSLWDITFTTSGANMLVQVTGAANNNISWTGYVEIISQN